MARHTGSIQKRGARSYRISYYDSEGIRQYETFKGGNARDAKEEAERQLAIRQGDLARGLPVSSKPNTILIEQLAVAVIRHYQNNKLSSLVDIEARLRLHVLPVFGKRRAVKVSTGQIHSYITQRRNQGATNGTINRELEALRRCFKLGMGTTPPKVVLMPHIPMLKENNVRKGFFEPEQLEALCTHLPAHLVPVVRFGYITGWRYGEVISRKWRHIDFAAGEIRLEPGETKNGEGRTFPMFDDLRALLESIRPEGKVPLDENVFLSECGDPIGRFDKAWATACEKAGLEVDWPNRHDAEGNPLVYKRGELKGEPRTARRAKVYFHGFRRTAYRNMVRLGAPQTVARYAVGWTDSKTADRYNITAKADLDVLRIMYKKVADGAKNGAK